MDKLVAFFSVCFPPAGGNDHKGRRFICSANQNSQARQVSTIALFNPIQTLKASLHAPGYLTALCLATQLVVASGCATVTSDPGNVTSQELTVHTDPANATCTVSRYGSNIGAIDSTPGTIKIARSIANVRVVCKKDGYLDAEDSVHSHLQKAFYGNLLWALGAGYAMVWDLSAGAAWQYDPNLNVRLIPSEFSSEAEREEFFESLRAPVTAEFQAASDEIAAKCRLDECNQQMKALKDNEAEALQKVEQLRQLTRVKQIGGA